MHVSAFTIRADASILLVVKYLIPTVTEHKVLKIQAYKHVHANMLSVNMLAYKHIHVYMLTC